MRTIKTGLYAILFLPLMLTPFTMFPWQFGRVIFFQVAVEILALAWLVLWWKFPDSLMIKKLNRLDWAVIIFLAILVVTSVTGVNFNNSFFGNQSRAQGVMLWLHLGVFYFLLKNFWQTEKEWRWYLSVGMVIVLAVGITAVFQSYLPDNWRGDLGPRLSGIVGNPAFLAAYLILPLFFAGSFFLQTKRVITRWAWLAATIAFAAIIWGTGIRGALVGVGFGGMEILCLAIFIFKHKIRRRAVIILVALAIIGAAVFFIVRLPVVANKFPTLAAASNPVNLLQSGTAQTRLMSWDIAWQGFLKHPWLGMGMGNYEVIFNQFYNPKFLNYGFKETVWDKPHNWLLELLVSSGIFGGLAYLALYAIAGQILLAQVKEKEKITEKLAPIILTSGLLAYFIQNLFLFETFDALLMFFVTLAFISNQLPANAPIKIKKIKFSILVISAGSILVAWLIWQYNYLPLRTSYYLALSENAGRYHNDQAVWAKNIQLSLQVPSYLQLESAVLAASTLDTIRKQNIIKDGADIKEAALTIAAALKQGADKYSQNYIYPVWAGQVYLALGEYVDAAYFEEGIKWLAKAKQIAPRKQEVYFLLGQTYLYQKNTSEAIKILQEAVAISSELGQPHWFLGLAYAASENYQAAISELTEGVKLDPSLQTQQNLLYFIDILAEEKDYAAILDYYKLLSQREPQEGYWHAKLAATYLALGDREMALQEITTAAVMDMRLQPAAQKFIEDNNLR